MPVVKPTSKSKGLVMTPTKRPTMGVDGSPAATRKRIGAVRQGSFKPRPVKRGY